MKTLLATILLLGMYSCSPAQKQEAEQVIEEVAEVGVEVAEQVIEHEIEAHKP